MPQGDGQTNKNLNSYLKGVFEYEALGKIGQQQQEWEKQRQRVAETA